MAIEIKSPYVNTPYDIFSDADDPKVGVLTPDASRDQVLQQQVRLLKQHKKDVRTINEASDLLKKGASRLSWDIFLTTTLSRSIDLDDLVEQYKKPQLPILKDPDWGAELSWIYQSPEDNIELFETPINRLSTYDTPPAQINEFTFEA